MIFSSDKFVDKAENIGLSLGISPFIIGVTIVAFGTSLPELATSIASIFDGNSEIVVTNVVGSNITNILLVLGVTAFISKNVVFDYDLMDVDMPFLVGSAFLSYFILNDSVVTNFEIFILLGGLASFLLNSFKADKESEAERPKSNPVDYLWVIGAGVLVYISSEFTISGLTGTSQDIGIPNELISLSALALGTSLPELFVSVMAIKKGKHGIAVGNVLGSNLFNTFGVLGIAALFGKYKVSPEIIDFGLPIMLATTLLFFVIGISRRISRWEGGMLVAFYTFYIYKLFEGVL